jgi:hypothetical protein
MEMEYHVVTGENEYENVMFVCLIIHTFQLVFSIGTVFSSPNKSTNSTFSYVFSTKRTGSEYQRGRFYLCSVRELHVLQFHWP